jgi:6,7-dimethyl-8-ribityllumazine synthase
MSDEPMQWDLEGRNDASGLKFAVIVSRFNASITEKLLEGTQDALKQASAEAIDIYDVPGAFELAFAAKQIAMTGRYDAIVALGAVIRGETPHFDYVAGECARGVQQVMLETAVPVAFGVLTTENAEQADARAGGKHGNKGFDAAMTAIEMVRFTQSITGGS